MRLRPYFGVAKIGVSIDKHSFTVLENKLSMFLPLSFVSILRNISTLLSRRRLEEDVLAVFEGRRLKLPRRRMMRAERTKKNSCTKRNLQSCSPNMMVIIMVAD